MVEGGETTENVTDVAGDTFIFFKNAECWMLECLHLTFTEYIWFYLGTKNWLNFSLHIFIPISMQNQDYLYSSFPSIKINLMTS